MDQVNATSKQVLTETRFGQDIGLVDRQLARAFATVAIRKYALLLESSIRLTFL